MIKQFVRYSLAALLLTLSSIGFANHNNEGKSCACMHDKIEAMAGSLNLTEQQQAKIKTIRSQFKDSMKAKMDEMKKLKMQAKALVHTDTLDEAKIDSIISQQKEVMGSMMKLKYTMKHDIYAVLSPEQKAKFAKAMEQHKKNKSESEDDN